MTSRNLEGGKQTGKYFARNRLEKKGKRKERGRKYWDREKRGTEDKQRNKERKSDTEKIK